jgi:hypothetical protein
LLKDPVIVKYGNNSMKKQDAATVEKTAALSISKMVNILKLVCHKNWKF